MSRHGSRQNEGGLPRRAVVARHPRRWARRPSTRCVRCPTLAATSASGSSAAVLVANAGMLKGKTSKRSVFNWRGSPDGGKTWVGSPSTAHAKTTVPNLVALSEWMFEVSVTIGAAAAGPWSQAVSVLIR
jgi:hypothetical protein